MKRRLLGILITVAMVVTSLPAMAFGESGDCYLSIQYSATKSFSYSINSVSEEDYIDVTIDEDHFGSVNLDHLEKGTVVRYRIEPIDGYRLAEEERTGRIVVSSISMTRVITPELIPAEPSYVLPEGLRILDNEGKDIPSEEGANWVVLPDAQHTLINVTANDVTLTGTVGNVYRLDLTLCGSSATIKDLVLPEYRDLTIDTNGDFNINIEGTNSVYMIYTRASKTTIGGAGTLNSKYLTSYSDGEGDVVVAGEKSLELNFNASTYEILDIDGDLIVNGGQINVSSDRELNKPIVRVDETIILNNCIATGKSQGDEEWQNLEIVSDEDGVYLGNKDSSKFATVVSIGKGANNSEISRLQAIIAELRTQISKLTEQLNKKADILIPPAKPSVSVKAGTRKLAVKWNAVSGANGYQVYYKKKGSSAKTITTTAKSKTIKKLSRKKKYTVKVRAYKTSGSTITYGAWSNAKTIKTK